MRKKLTADAARQFLSDVNPECCFWLNDGRTLRNLEELLAALKDMDAALFKYHVNKERNDFSNWVFDIVRDEALAKEIKRCRAKSTTLAKIKKRVTQLKRAAAK